MCAIAEGSLRHLVRAINPSCVKFHGSPAKFAFPGLRAVIRFPPSSAKGCTRPVHHQTSFANVQSLPPCARQPHIPGVQCKGRTRPHEGTERSGGIHDPHRQEMPDEPGGTHRSTRTVVQNMSNLTLIYPFVNPLSAVAFHIQDQGRVRQLQFHANFKIQQARAPCRT